MQHKKLLSLSISTALGLTSSLALSTAAVAQDEQLDDGEAVLEEVLVTGSRIATMDGFGRTSPVTVVGMEAIESTGLTRVEDVLNSLPSVETGLHSFDANGISGTASVDLRGLGAFRTLVLVNGRRMQPGGVQATAVDVNQIPAAMVERIEVLTGGASATYGADAVAGVVNFIMRRVDGFEISAGISGYQHNNDNKFIQDLLDRRNFDYPTGSSGYDGKAYNIDMVVGGDFANGAGNATLYATWRENEAFLQGERDYASCALSEESTSCGGSANAIVPNFFIAPASGGMSDYSRSLFLSMQDGGALEPWDGTNRYNYAPVNHFMRPDERWSLGGFVDFEFNEHAIAYLEVNFANDRTQGQIAESGTFFNEEYFLPLDNSNFPEQWRNDMVTYFDNQFCHEYDADNPNICLDISNDPTDALGQLPGYGELMYFPGEDPTDPTQGEWLPFDEYGVYIGKRNVEGGPRSSNFAHDGFRIVTGLKGAINENWDYDVSYLYGSTSSSMAYINDFFAPNIRTAVDGEACAAAAGCIPYEVFTYNGVTPEQANNMLGTAIMQGKTYTRVINGYVTGDLGWNVPSTEDNVMVVAGFEHREEFYERVSDSVFQQGSLLGQGGPTPGVVGKYSVQELFFEANIPLVSGISGAEHLNLDLAYRYSDYSTAGDTSTYRIGLDWQPIEMVRLRFGYNHAVRAPNVIELFGAQSLGLWSGSDPCSGADPTYTQAQCANTGVTAAQYGRVTASPAGQYNGIFGGNPNLEPEAADTFTLGIVVEPLDGMQISVDYWDIEIEDTIANIGATTILEQCGLYGVLCGQIVRHPSGNLWQGQNAYVVDTTLNLGERSWEGIDLAFNYGTDLWAGSLSTNLIGTYMMTKEYTPLPADKTSAYDCVGLVSTRCFASPEWRHTWGVTYDSNEWWSLTLRWRYFQGVDYDGDVDTIAQKEMSAGENYFDLSSTFRFMESHDVVIGINNIMDEEPPMVGDSLTTSANTIGGFYDMLGRYIYGNVTFRF